MRRKPKDRPVARPSLNKRERERLERISAEYAAKVEAAERKRSAGKPSPSAEPPPVDESSDPITDGLIRRMTRSRRPTNGERKESDQAYRDLKEATDRATPAPIFPEQSIKPEEAMMAKKKTEEKKPEVTARKGDKVRVVHRNTDGGWRLWEMETNKMIVHKLFGSERAATQFATEHGLEPIKTGGRKPESEKKKASPAAATAKKPATKKAPKTATTPAPAADSNGSTPAAVESEQQQVQQEVA